MAVKILTLANLGSSLELDNNKIETIQPEWTQSTVSPTATGNTGILPRFVEDSSTSTKWYIDKNGNARQLVGASTSLKPELVPVRDFKTEIELATLGSTVPYPNDGASYIATSGINKGDIAIWDEVTTTWIYYTPENDDITTVTNPSNSAYQGKWKYNLSTDTWTQTQSGIELQDLIERPVAQGNFAWGRTASKYKTKYVGGNSQAYIQNDKVAIYGNNSNFTSGGENAENSVPRKISWNWFNGVSATYSPIGQYIPKFVDVDNNYYVMLATDHLGKLWACGSQLMGTGLTTTPLGTVAATDAPNYGLQPVPFFQAKTDLFIDKIYMNNVYYNFTNTISAVLCTNGELYLAGYNGHGALGQGNTTVTSNWVKYPISNVIDVKISTFSVMVLTAEGNLYFNGYDIAGLVNNTTSNKTTPVLIASDVKTWDYKISNDSTITDLMYVKKDGTVWGKGQNEAGILGLGFETTDVNEFRRVPNMNDVKNVYLSKVSASGYSAVLKTDGTALFAGRNNNGVFGYSQHTTATNSSVFVTPSFSAQGLIVDVLLGYNSTTVITTNGDVWQTGGTGARGLGFLNNTWSNMNKWQKTPLSEGVLSVIGFCNDTTNAEGYNALTKNHGIIAWGGGYPSYINATGGSEFYRSPREIPETALLNNGILISNPLAGKYTNTSVVSAITSSSITSVLDGASNKLVTATLVVDGTIGKVDLTNTTLTGVGIDAKLVTDTVYLSSTTNNTVKITFSVNANELIAEEGADQIQNWSLTFSGITVALSSIRTNDPVYFSLTGSNISAYSVASPGAWINVTESEYKNVLENLSNPLKAGLVDSKMYTQGTAAGTTNMYSQAVDGLDSYGKLPANHYLIAATFYATAINTTTSIMFGNNILPQSATYSLINNTVPATAGQNYLVRKKAPINTSAGVLAIKANGNLAYVTATSPTKGYYGTASGTTTATSWAQNCIQLQGIYTTNKPY